MTSERADFEGQTPKMKSNQIGKTSKYPSARLLTPIYDDQKNTCRRNGYSSILYTGMLLDEKECVFSIFYLTRRRLSAGIFSAKNVMHQHGFEPTISCLPGRRTTNFVMVTRIYYLNDVIK